MPKPIEEQVIVITGASSGIGLLTAIKACRRGAKVVVSGRSRQDVEGAVDEVESAGGSVIGVPADVTSPSQLEYLADRAVEQFGRIDAWINCAAAGSYGLVKEQSLEEFRRVLEVHFVGQALGAEVALPYLEETEGAFICIGSCFASGQVPIQSAYSAAQNALNGWIEGVRLELRKESSPVRVTLVKSASSEGPLVQRGPSVGLQAAEPPVFDLEVVSDAILEAAQSNKRDIRVGRTGKSALGWTQRVRPKLQQLTQHLPLLKSHPAESGEPESGEPEAVAGGRPRRIVKWVSVAGAGAAAVGAAGYYGWRKYSEHQKNGAGNTAGEGNLLPEFPAEEEPLPQPESMASAKFPPSP